MSAVLDDDAANELDSPRIKTWFADTLIGSTIYVVALAQLGLGE